MAKILEQILSISLYLVIFPIGIGLYRWPWLTRPLLIFWLSLVCGLLITLAGDYLVSQHITNHALFYVNTAIDAVLMTCFFTAFMTRSLRWLFSGGAAAVWGYLGWSVRAHGISLTGSMQASSLETCMVVAMALVVLTGQFRQSASQSLRQQPAVYISFGVLLVNLITLVLNFGGSQLYTYSAELFNLFWDTLAPLAGLLSTLFACIGLWQSRTYIGQFA
jgi:hypothetical protein